MPLLRNFAGYVQTAEKCMHVIYLNLYSKII
jgi:hypothetical protein